MSLKCLLGKAELRGWMEGYFGYEASKRRDPEFNEETSGSTKTARNADCERGGKSQISSSNPQDEEWGIRNMEDPDSFNWQLILPGE